MKWGLTKRTDEQIFGIDSFRKEITRLFDDFFTVGPSSFSDANWMPTVDVEEDEKAIHVKAEIPGIDEKDLNVTFQHNVLTISGEKKEEKKEENKKYVVSERRFGSFHRSIALPDEIKSDEITAYFKDGVLKIEIPKARPSKPDRIKIDIKEKGGAYVHNV